MTRFGHITSISLTIFCFLLILCEAGLSNTKKIAKTDNDKTVILKAAKILFQNKNGTVVGKVMRTVIENKNGTLLGEATRNTFENKNATMIQHKTRTLVENKDGTIIRKAARTIIENENGNAVRKAATLRHRIIHGNDTQCFEGLGCFPMDYPWTSILRPLPPPLSPGKIDVQLYCYTRQENKRHTVTLWPEVSMNKFFIQPSRKLVLITHGFINNGNASWMAELKDYYLQEEDVTVCLVDWGFGAQRLNYLQAASNTRVVGAELARFLKFLQTNQGIEASNVHLIGHSLGAQISSYIAKGVYGIKRLTALDPAQPAFEGCDQAVRLCKDDADFVEVIHTNAAPFLPFLGFGMMMPCGDVDFYINGGVKQPGCQSATLANVRSIRDLATIPVEMIANLVACSHLRAFEYYKEVLQRNCTIWGRLATVTSRSRRLGSSLSLLEPRVTTNVTTCDQDTCLPLGLDTPQFKARGVFLASTHTEAPYCYGPDFTSKILSEINSNMKKLFLKTATIIGNKTSTIENSEEYLQ